MVRLRVSFKDRFQENVSPEPNTGCWLWMGPHRVDGYGVFGGMTKLAHRLSYEAFVGPIRFGGVVMHMCDNPTCVNPAHLRVGTQKDNVHDMIAKGRNYVLPSRHGAQQGNGRNGG